ncbi:MAG: aspartate--tRNA(Asn) ligase, partial [Candidatus Micrarchaeota archaeon]|nr:aspartate--tRNA(Asn) ligase [Candidatus Micrarchaeota archaeon]
MIRTHYIEEITAEMDGEEVVIAGWVHEVRETSKITFLLVRDRSGIAQVLGKEGVIEEKTRKKMSLPKESVVSVRGTIKVSKEAKKGFEIVPSEIHDLNPLSTQIPFEVTG